MENKLFTLLAKTDALANRFKGSLKDYITFFNKAQGAFLGVHKTYIAQPETIDEPNRRGTLIIQTTVDEKLNWLEESNSEYIDALFALEATNASGLPRAELVVEGESWGEFSSLELLRLKSLLETGELKKMYETIPVRSDGVIWNETTAEAYRDRDGIFETEIIKQVNRTTLKEDYILTDPNIDKINTTKQQYSPQVSQKNTVVILGEGTEQTFSGQWSQRQRASALRRLDILHVAVIEALKVANDCEVRKSALNAEKLFGFIHGKQTT